MFQGKTVFPSRRRRSPAAGFPPPSLPAFAASDPPCLRHPYSGLLVAALEQYLLAGNGIFVRTSTLTACLQSRGDGVRKLLGKHVTKGERGEEGRLEGAEGVSLGCCSRLEKAQIGASTPRRRTEGRAVASPKLRHTGRGSLPVAKRSSGMHGCSCGGSETRRIPIPKRRPRGL